MSALQMSPLAKAIVAKPEVIEPYRATQRRFVDKNNRLMRKLCPGGWLFDFRGPFWKTRSRRWEWQLKRLRVRRDRIAAKLAASVGFSGEVDERMVSYAIDEARGRLEFLAKEQQLAPTPAVDRGTLAEQLRRRR